MELKRIEDLIKSRRSEGYEDGEIMLEIEALMPSKTIYIEKPLKSSKQKLEYNREYRLIQKELEQIKAEKQDEEDFRTAKINQALKRKGYFCFKCKVPVSCNPEDNKYSITLKRNEKRERIIVENKCPHCQVSVKQFGGFL